MKESVSKTITTERTFEFTKAEVELLLRREILGGDVQAKVVFQWHEIADYDAATDVAVTATNTVTERS